MDFENLIRDKLKDELDIEVNLTTPPNPAMGDFAFPCFQLAKEKDQNPVEVAKALAYDLKI